MVKKKPKIITLWTNKKKEELGIYELRWESMRRSKEYIEDYNNYRKTCDDIYIKSKSADTVNEYEKEQIRFFAEKYRIAFPLDPSISTWFPEEFSSQQGSLVASLWNKDKPKLINETLSYWIKGVICLDSDKHIVGAPYGEVPDYEPLTEEELRKKDSIKVVIDLNSPLPKIKKEVGRIVEHWQKLRSKVVSQKLPRLRLKEYKVYLEIYDLRTKDKFTFKEIAKRKFPKEYKEELKKVESSSKDSTKQDELWAKYQKQGDDVDTAYKKAYGTEKTPEEEEKKSSNKVIQRAMDSFNAAVRLIEEGGYKEIR